MFTRRTTAAWLSCFLLSLLAGPPLRAATPPAVPNAAFDQGDAAPQGWQLVGTGRWVDRQAVEVTGDGQDSSYWRCGDLDFEPGRLYRFEVRARQVRGDGSGCAITGPSFANRDYGRLSEQWTRIGHVFRAPDQVRGEFLRLGQWHARGTLQFDDVRLVPVLPVHRRCDGIVLGEGELIRDGRYEFLGNFAHEGSNDHRPLQSATAGFNSNRWVFGSGSQVTYRFAIPGHELTSGTVQANVSYYDRGSCHVEVSRDGRQWLPLLKADGLNACTATVPGELLPAAELLVRFRGDDGPTSLQIDRIEFQAQLGGRPPEAAGETRYAELVQATGAVALESLTLVRDPAAGSDAVRLVLANRSAAAVDVNLACQEPERPPQAQPPRRLAPQGTGTWSVPLAGAGVGQRDVQFTATGGGRLEHRLPAASDHARFLPRRLRRATGRSAGRHPAVWWCDATRKVPRGRAVPEPRGTAVRLEAARGDWEAAQVVVRPEQAAARA